MFAVWLITVIECDLKMTNYLAWEEDILILCNVASSDKSHIEVEINFREAINKRQLHYVLDIKNIMIDPIKIHKINKIYHIKNIINNLNHVLTNKHLCHKIDNEVGNIKSKTIGL